MPTLILTDEALFCHLREQYAKRRRRLAGQFMKSELLLHQPTDKEYSGETVKLEAEPPTKLFTNDRTLLSYAWEEPAQLASISVRDRVLFHSRVPNSKELFKQYCYEELDYEYLPASLSFGSSQSVPNRCPRSILFLVHGLHGSHSDFGQLQSRLSLYLKDTLIVLCQSIEDKKPEDTLERLGQALAEEVESLLNQYDEAQNDEEYTISFIGFSLGTSL